MSDNRPVFKICVAGHSLVLPDFTHPLCEVCVLRQPGAKVNDFESAPLNKVFASHWDLVAMLLKCLTP